MTRLAFVTWDGGSNVPPAVGIAQDLASRGHDVVFLAYEAQRKRFEAQGLAFNALRRSVTSTFTARTNPPSASQA